LVWKTRRVVQAAEVVVDRGNGVGVPAVKVLKSFQRPQVVLLGQGKLAKPLVDHREVVPELRRDLLRGWLQCLIVLNRLLIERCRHGFALAEVQERGEAGANLSHQCRLGIGMRGHFKRLFIAGLTTGHITRLPLRIRQGLQRTRQSRQIGRGTFRSVPGRRQRRSCRPQRFFDTPLSQEVGGVVIHE
jgi:hypothetical protein